MCSEERQIAMAEKQLPLPDYDETPLTSLSHQIRALEADEIRTLLEYERAHANRVPVIEVLSTRLEQLEQGAQPSGGDPRAKSAKPADTAHGSPVSGDGAAKPSGPLRHGVAGHTPERDRP